MISEKVLNAIELNKVLDKVKIYLCIEKACEKLLYDKPCENFDEAKALLSLTKEADRIISTHNIDPVSSIDDIENVLIKAIKQSTLTIMEILRVSHLLRSSRLFKTKVSAINDNEIMRMKFFADRLFINKSFEDEVSRCFISEEQVSDNATENLATIRKNIRKINEDVKNKLTSILHLSENSRYIQDFLVTIRSGRYVIPIKSEYKNNVRGMLHDQSATGATVYIEPEAVVFLNNDLRILQIKEHEEIEKILLKFTAEVSQMAEYLKYNAEILIDADIAFAKAKYAHSIKAVCPLLNSNGYINIINGRHPLIDKDKIVPVSVSLGKDYNFLVITGPNTGGKTVTLKLCGLFSAMAMCGLFLPALDGTEISFFNRIFTDIGDEQSIEQNLSTFSSHIKNIVEITKEVSSSSLVLIDEIGVGTDPVEGAALALSILEFLLGSGCKGIITTHYNEVKEYAFISKGAMNASMEFDPVKLIPTYKLNIGMPGSSNALEISRKLGLSEEIISAAYKHICSEKITFETILKSAEEARSDAEKNLAKTEAVKKEYEEKLTIINNEQEKIKNLKENILQNSKFEAKRIYSSAVSESEQLIEELKNIIKSDEITEYDLNRARQIKKRLENNKYSFGEDENISTKDLIPVNEDNIYAGQKVFIKSLSSKGIIESVIKNKNEAKILMGNFSANIKFNDIFLCDEKPLKNKEIKKPTVSIIKQLFSGSGVNEIKLLGQTVLEALPNVDAFLDSCSINAIKECKIIHGVGTGALRKAVCEHLKTHPLVENFRSGKYGEGERGVTIVTLK